MLYPWCHLTELLEKTYQYTINVFTLLHYHCFEHYADSIFAFHSVMRQSLLAPLELVQCHACSILQLFMATDSSTPVTMYAGRSEAARDESLPVSDVQQSAP